MIFLPQGTGELPQAERGRSACVNCSVIKRGDAHGGAPTAKHSSHLGLTEKEPTPNDKPVPFVLRAAATPTTEPPSSPITPRTAFHARRATVRSTTTATMVRTSPLLPPRSPSAGNPS